MDTHPDEEGTSNTSETYLLGPHIVFRTSNSAAGHVRLVRYSRGLYTLEERQVLEMTTVSNTYTFRRMNCSKEMGFCIVLYNNTDVNSRYARKIDLSNFTEAVDLVTDGGGNVVI